MALSLDAAVPMGDALAVAVSPSRLANPLKNKIVHADIRISSIEDEPKNESVALRDSEALVRRMPSQESIAYQKQKAEMQMWWDEAIAKNLNLPDGYAKVAVLLIKWADEVDELRTGKEVRASAEPTGDHVGGAFPSDQLARLENSKLFLEIAFTTTPLRSRSTFAGSPSTSSTVI